MSEQRKKVVVLGAGVTGLGAAYRLAKKGNCDVHVIEKETMAGGVCRSFQDGDFIFDYGPHKFYTLLDGILDEVKAVMGSDLMERDKRQTLYLGNRYYEFPLKMSEMVLHFPLSKSTKVLSHFAVQLAKNKLQPKTAVSYEDFIIERFGKGLYQEILEPMAKKMFGSPDQLDRKLAEVRLSSPGLIAIIKQLLSMKKADKTVSADVFHYPKYGFGMIPQRFQEAATKHGAKFHLGSRLLNINIENGKVKGVVFEDGRGETHRLECDHLIYTIPLSSLKHLIREEMPSDVRKAVSGISYRNTIIYYFLVKSRPLLPSMWAFFPEQRFRFGRLSEMIKFSPYVAPPGYTSLMVDFTCQSDDVTWSMDDATLGKMLFEQLKPLKLFAPEQIVKSFSKRFNNFYPIYQVGYQDNLSAVRTLEQRYKNLYFIGRLGDFNYNNSDQCLDMGFRAADHIQLHSEVSDEWLNLRKNNFEHYRIVD